MKKALILSGMLLALTASLASAAPGLHLSWGDCGANGLVDRGGAASGFECNTNSNSLGRASLMYGTYLAPAGVPNMVGNECVVDYQIAGGILPPWWDFNGCRAGQLLFQFRSGSSCTDWPGTAGVSGNMTVTNVPPDRARIRLIGAYTSGSPQALVADTEYNSFLLTINNAMTVGTPNCAGRQQAGCFVLNSIKINQFPANPTPVVVENPGPNGNHVTWRGGTGLNCPGATPSPSSWGQLKSLYR